MYADRSFHTLSYLRKKVSVKTMLVVTFLKWSWRLMERFLYTQKYPLLVPEVSSQEISLATSENSQVPISRWVDKKSVVHLHNGILRSRKKEGAPTLRNSMDGTEEYYAKWNKPGGERQIPYGITYKRNLMNKIESLTESDQREEGRGIMEGRRGRD